MMPGRRVVLNGDMCGVAVATSGERGQVVVVRGGCVVMGGRMNLCAQLLGRVLGPRTKG